MHCFSFLFLKYIAITNAFISFQEKTMIEANYLFKSDYILYQ